MSRSVIFRKKRSSQPGRFARNIGLLVPAEKASKARVEYNTKHLDT